MTVKGRDMTMPGIGRRQALGVAGVAACGVALTACGSDAKAEPVAGIKGQELAKTSEVPVGGGKLVTEWKIVVTQPTEGVFKAFSAVCSHKGCTVASPQRDVMTCPCHGSEFAADTGKAVKGPATAPLLEYRVAIKGDGIVVA